MKSKISYWLNLLWSCIVAFTFPICFGLIYLNLTGYAKGYSYNLGGEKDISVLLGVIELIIWLVFALPSNLYVFSKTKKNGRKYLYMLIALYVILAVGCIFLTGGFAAYTKGVFNIE
ncbi:MAG: hypothetical protein IKK66_06815 [Ruminococcus sp.]|nr:hypothetical protein [Ruminococcus sp.]